MPTGRRAQALSWKKRRENGIERLDSHETIGTAIPVGGSGNKRGAHDVESRRSWGAQGLATYAQSSNSSAASRLALPPAAEVLMVIVCSEAKRMR